MKSKNKGFSLVELIIAMTIMAIVSYGIASFLVSGMDAWVFIKSRETGLSSARSALERITREVRRIKKPNNIVMAATTECAFVDINSSLVDFYQNGGNLMRSSEGVSYVLVSDLATPEGIKFTYYDSGMNATDVRQNMRFIKARLCVIKGTESVTLEDGARIRNL